MDEAKSSHRQLYFLDFGQDQGMGNISSLKPEQLDWFSSAGRPLLAKSPLLWRAKTPNAWKHFESKLWSLEIIIDCKAKPLTEYAGRRRRAELEVPRVREVVQPKRQYSGAYYLLISIVKVVARGI